MNSHDLTLAAINGEAERVPFNPFIMHLAASIDKIDYCKEYCQNAKVLANAQIKCAKTFGIDHVNVSTDAYREASAWGLETDFSGHTPVANGEFSIDDFNTIDEPDLNAAPRIQNRIEGVKFLEKLVGGEQCIVGWIEAPFAEICCLFGLINISKLARDPDWDKRIKSLIDRILPVQLEFAKLQIEAGADVIGAGDSAISQIGPKRYKDACLNATQSLFRSIQNQVPVLYHTCGDNSIIDKDGRDMLKLIANSGASILDIDYQVDLKMAKNKIGNRICIRGNTRTDILGSRVYTPDIVLREITKTIEDGKPNGRYMYAAGCEWPWEPLDVASRNLGIARTMIDRIGGY